LSHRKNVDARRKAGHDGGNLSIAATSTFWRVIASVSEANHLGPAKKAGLLRRFTPRNGGIYYSCFTRSDSGSVMAGKREASFARRPGHPRPVA